MVYAVCCVYFRTHSLSCPTLSSTTNPPSTKSPPSIPEPAAIKLPPNIITEPTAVAAVSGPVVQTEVSVEKSISNPPSPPPTLALHFPQISASCHCIPPDYCENCRAQLHSAGLAEKELQKTADAIRATQAMGTPYIRGRVIRHQHSRSSSPSAADEVRISLDQEAEEEEEMRGVVRIAEQHEEQQEEEKVTAPVPFFNQRALDDTVHVHSQSDASRISK